MPLTGIASVRPDDGPRPNTDLMQDFKLWRHQVCQALQGLLTFDARRAASGVSASAGFQVVLQVLYVESHFTEFLSYQAWRQAGLDEEAGHALNALRQQLDAYDEPDTDVAILADPMWWHILGQVTLVVALLE